MVLGVGTDVEAAGDAAMQCYTEKQSYKSVCYIQTVQCTNLQPVSDTFKTSICQKVRYSN